MEKIVIEWGDSTEECNSTITVCLQYESVDVFKYDLEVAVLKYIEAHSRDIELSQKWWDENCRLSRLVANTHNPKKKEEFNKLWSDHLLKRAAWATTSAEYHARIGGVKFDLSQFVNDKFYYAPDVYELSKWFDIKCEEDTSY